MIGLQASQTNPMRIIFYQELYMDWQSLIKTVAPWLGTALGGPLGGMAVTAIADALGVSEKTTDAVKQAISGITPEQMLALKSADQNFAITMQKMGFDHLESIEKLSNDDRSSARQREMSVRDYTPMVLAATITIGFFGVLTKMMIGHPVENSDVLNIMLGSLGTAWTGVVAYYFGSSAGSQRKTELLAQSTPTDK
jgi:hypothetical protein